MSFSMNEVTLAGYLGQDPEVRSTQSGRKVCNLSVATSESWKDKNSGERKQKTAWHRVTVWNEGLVGVLQQYAKKGSKVFVRGSLVYGTYTDKDGIERTTAEIKVDGYRAQVSLMDNKPAQDGEQRQQNGGGDLDDEIPF